MHIGVATNTGIKFLFAFNVEVLIKQLRLKHIGGRTIIDIVRGAGFIRIRDFFGFASH
jgi:hypothetical protein